MGVFDTYADEPFQIKIEGRTITLTWKPGLPVTGQGTVEWDLPVPAQGCQTAEDGRGAYCGMVVLLSNSPLAPDQAPVDGTTYISDPTADPDAHAGDKINGALVVGAFYEGDERSRGEELTTSFVISDLESLTDYYVAGYAVDCERRYHTEGVRGYSDEYGQPDEQDLPAIQDVALEGGVIPTDGTGLTAGFLYSFEIIVDPTCPGGEEERRKLITVDGTDASTYANLLDELNKQLAQIDDPPQSPTPPFQGRYYWDSSEQQLYQWDGQRYILVEGVLVEPTDPANPPLGSYWFNPDTNELKRWIGSPPTWVDTDFIVSDEDPRNLTYNNYWFDGSQGYSWCPNTWCEETTFVQSDDPTCGIDPSCGDYWYDTTNEQLFEWSEEQNQWVETFAIQWDTEPNNLDSGTYWYDTTNAKLFQWTGSPLAWEEQNVIISEDEPSIPADGTKWYNPATEELRIYSTSSPEGWTLTPVIVWPDDPTDTETCDLWWNTAGSPNTLLKWDVVNNEWDPVPRFIQSSVDPTDDVEIPTGSLWLSPAGSPVGSPIVLIMQRWDGNRWVQVDYIAYPTDPTLPASGSVWYNPTTEEWFVWDVGSPGGTWTSIDPIDSTDDPFALPSGTLWFNTSTDVLSERVGSSWMSVPYITTAVTPSDGDMWFDTTNDVLNEWDHLREMWVPGTPLVQVYLTEIGNMRFETSFKGSSSCVLILIPEDSESGKTARSGGLATGQAGIDVPVVSDRDREARLEVALTVLRRTTVKASEFLFDFLEPSAAILRPLSGQDGVRGIPSYDQIGVGDDGSPDERRELISSVRRQLGYPVIEVELSNEQFETAVDLALEELRRRSSSAYKRGFFFMDVQAGIQSYKLTNRTVGFHRIVTIMAAYRFTSAFLSTAHGAGVYGQVVLQHLYNMGTFDLLSFHLVSQYIEQLEHLFATRLTYHWHEPTRTLDIYHSFVHPERILIDCSLELPEQELFKDRWTKTWIERYTLAESMRILSQIRGKYATLPGAGGGVSLNASDLMTQHDAIKEQLYQQLDDYVVNDAEDIGMHSQFIIG